MDEKKIILEGVREYNESCEVSLIYNENERPLIEALNLGNFDATLVDLWDLLTWIRLNKPEYLAFSYPREKQEQCK